MAFRGKRSFKTGPHHNCGRCGIKGELSKMQWDNGVLVGPECYDGTSPQERDSSVARAIKNAAMNPDALPDPKLTEPNQIIQSIIDEILI